MVSKPLALARDPIRDEVVDVLRIQKGRRVPSTATAGECFMQCQNAPLITRVRSQLNIAQGLAAMLGTITTVLNRAKASTRRILGKATSVLWQT